MKTNFKRTIARIAITTMTLGLVGTALAADKSDQITRLEVAKDRLANGALSVKPNQAGRMRDQAADLQKLIDEAQSGKKLDPTQVDNAIRRSYQGF